MKVSTVISTGKHPSAIYGLLSTFASQSYFGNELLIINYYSNDEDRELYLSNNLINHLLDYISRFVDVRLKSIHQPYNVGTTKVHRFEYAANELIWYLDDDLIVLDNECLERMVETYLTLEKYTDGKYLNISPKIIAPRGIQIGKKETEFRKYFYPEEYKPNFMNHLLSSDMVEWGMLIRKEFGLKFTEMLPNFCTAEGTLYTNSKYNFGTIILPDVKVMHVPQVSDRKPYELFKHLIPKYLEVLE